jgi:hypothetical protein
MPNIFNDAVIFREHRVFLVSQYKFLRDSPLKQHLRVNISKSCPLYRIQTHQAKLNMKVAALIVSCFLGSAFAAPAIVWSNDKQGSESVVHSSKSVKSSSLLSELVHGSSDESALAAAVFLIGRAPDGSDSLSGLASSGSLPLVASKYDDATAIHSHVAGIESPFTVARDAGANTGKRVLEITLSEFSSKLTSLGQTPEKTEHEVDENGMMNKKTKYANNRARALAQADLVIVNVPASTDPSQLDDAVVKAVEHKSVGSVVLASVRSTAEVLQERGLQHRRKMSVMQNQNRRRLEQDNGDDANNADDDTTGVYYVHMTPNILAGLLFALLFTVVTYIGISCMGQIQGQDVYVTKMPTIGREA